MGRTKPTGLRFRWLALALVVLGILVLLDIANRPQPLNPDDARKARVGMTLTEVTKLFGSRPDREFIIPDEPHSLEGLPPLPVQPDQTAAWETDSDGVIVVYFANDHAVGAFGNWRGSDPLWARLRRWSRLDF
jgi:hypothetical protein